jgi:hypothetical protein
MSDRCPVCGKMRNEPTGELIGYQIVDGHRETYERQAHQLDAGTRTLCEQLTGANRADLIAVSSEFRKSHVVLAAEPQGKVSRCDPCAFTLTLFSCTPY